MTFLKQARLLFQIGIIQALIRCDAWLRAVPADLKRVFKLASWMTALYLLMSVLNVAILSWVGISFEPATFFPERIPFVLLLIVLLLIAILEELVFRIAPLGILAWHGAHTSTLLVTAAVSSVIFGYMHGGLANIPVQGLSGLILSLLFLKCGGITGTRRGVLIGAGACICSHFVWNIIIAVVLIAI